METQLSTVEQVKTLLRADAYKKRFEEVMGKRAPQFMASIANTANQSGLRAAEPKSIIAAAFVAATLDLPIDRNLGFAWVVPYNGKQGTLGQFQMGWKGYVQLALRTSQYRRLNAQAVNAEAFDGYDEIGEPKIDWSRFDPIKPIVGYVMAWQLVNGFTKVCYWTKERVEAHARRYSQSYRGGYDSAWKTHFDEMALKTVIMNELRRWGILSIEMQRAYEHDQGAQQDVDSEVEFIDNMKVVEPVIEDDDDDEIPMEDSRKADATPLDVDAPPANPVPPLPPQPNGSRRRRTKVEMQMCREAAHLIMVRDLDEKDALAKAFADVPANERPAGLLLMREPELRTLLEHLRGTPETTTDEAPEVADQQEEAPVAVEKEPEAAKPAPVPAPAPAPAKRKDQGPFHTMAMSQIRSRLDADSVSEDEFLAWLLKNTDGLKSLNDRVHSLSDMSTDDLESVFMLLPKAMEALANHPF